MLALLVTSGCGSDDEGRPAYARCQDATDVCAVGTCDYDPFMGYTCEIDCQSDSDCPAPPDGGLAICGEGTCRPTPCDDRSGLEGIACVDGTLQHCDALSDPPCSQCPVCPEGEHCVAEACLPDKAAGQPCDPTLSECPGGSTCRSLVLTNSELLYGGQSFCSLPVGSPCWPGDPCFCSEGACTFSCESDDDCSDGSECVSKGGTDFSPTCRRRCEPAEEGTCGEGAVCMDIGLATTVSEVNVCKADGERPPRPEGFPCMTDAECSAGACCAPVNDDWGRCSGDAGC
jgi:hypothetical protein